MIGIHGVHDCRFLADQQHPFSVRQLYQNGRRSDIDIRAGVVRATGFGAPGSQAMLNASFSVSCRDHRIFPVSILRASMASLHLGGGLRKIVAGADVDAVMLGIDA